MKITIALLTIFILLFSGTCLAFYKDEVSVQYKDVASCSSDNCPDPQYQKGSTTFKLSSNDSWDDQYGYRTGSPCSACACTDPGYHWNTCINRSEYCEVFGNVGAI